MKRVHSGSLFAMTVNSRLYQHVNNRTRGQYIFLSIKHGLFSLLLITGRITDITCIGSNIFASLGIHIEVVPQQALAHSLSLSQKTSNRFSQKASTQEKTYYTKHLFHWISKRKKKAICIEPSRGRTTRTTTMQFVDLFRATIAPRHWLTTDSGNYWDEDILVGFYHSTSSWCSHAAYAAVGGCGCSLLECR